MKRNVVVTGIGLVTPIGNNLDSFTNALFAGRSGAATVTRFDASGLATRIAAEVKNFDSSFKDIKISFALEAAQQAMSQAFPKVPVYDPLRAQLSIGLGLELFSVSDLIESRSPDFIAPTNGIDAMTFMNTPSDVCAHMLSRQHRLGQPPLIHVSACAASTDAIGTAFEAIRSGRLDVALAGGTDSMINPMGLGGFDRIGALSHRNEDPEQASRPFDSERDGFLLGEGAGFLVLESYDHAQKRGAKILAQISGYGNALDAYSISDPHPDGEGAERAMRAALGSANRDAKELSAVSAHGTGTEKNDLAEAAALKRLLQEQVETVAVFATKSMIGHLISASGVVETIAVIQCIRRGMVHHTINLQEVEKGCELRHVVDAPLKLELKHVLKNSFGFGGKNSCLIISAAE
jgi:3-oxoacyl-[acyl-carrier-protein] synthase II